jgi:hypothetical protein
MVKMEMNIERPETQTELSVVVRSAHPKDTAEKRHGAPSRIYQVSFEALRTCPKLRMFLSECRNFLLRSRIVLTNKDTHRVPTGPAYLEAQSGRVFRNTRSLACSQDIEKLSSNRPSTPLDWIAYRDSWEAGAEWAVSTLRSDTLDSEHKALLVSMRLR